jgi:hypothetical protein
VPYVSIVDPYTLKEIVAQKGGFAAGGLMKAVTEVRSQLAKDFKERGPSIKRSALKKVESTVKEIEATLAKDGVAKALPDFRKLEASIVKEADVVKAKAKELGEKLLDAAKADLDKAEGLIGSGDVKGAKAILSPLAGVLKGTDLARRVSELLDKTKPVAEPAK